MLCWLWSEHLAGQQWVGLWYFIPHRQQYLLTLLHYQYIPYIIYYSPSPSILYSISTCPLVLLFVPSATRFNVGSVLVYYFEFIIILSSDLFPHSVYRFVILIECISPLISDFSLLPPIAFKWSYLTRLSCHLRSLKIDFIVHLRQIFSLFPPLDLLALVLLLRTNACIRWVSAAVVLLFIPVV